MAIINCPECGKEISDKSKHCIHCGFPLEKDEAKIDQGNSSYKVMLLSNGNSKVSVIKEIREITGCSLSNANILVSNLPSCVVSNINYDKAKKYWELLNSAGATASIEKMENKISSSKICPICKNENSINANICSNCGYIWNQQNNNQNNKQNNGVGFGGIVLAIIVAVIILAFL